ncbi:10302_t:CDS:2, partial [Ambispora leptoticha]
TLIKPNTSVLSVQGLSLDIGHNSAIAPESYRQSSGIFLGSLTPWNQNTVQFNNSRELLNNPYLCYVGALGVGGRTSKGSLARETAMTPKRGYSLALRKE